MAVHISNFTGDLNRERVKFCGALGCDCKMDLQEVGGGRGDWMELAQDRDRWRALVGTVRDFRVP